MAYTLQTHGGSKIKDVLADIFARASKRDIVNIGFLENATYPTGVSPKSLRQQYADRKKKGLKGAIPAARGGQTVASVAAANEFGVPAHGQPPRPFFRAMIASKSPAWGKRFAVVLKATNYNADQALRLMGEGIAAQLKKSILETNSPPLAESTVKRKGFDKPLVDTGHMLNSIGYEVK